MLVDVLVTTGVLVGVAVEVAVGVLVATSVLVGVDVGLEERLPPPKSSNTASLALINQSPIYPPLA